MKTKKILSFVALVSIFAGYIAHADSTPDNFSFTPKTWANVNTDYTSNTITVKWIDAPVSIWITWGGTIIFLSGSGWSTVNKGDKFQVKLTSASTYNTKKTAIVTIWWIGAGFSVTTMKDDLNWIKFSTMSSVEPDMDIYSSIKIPSTVSWSLAVALSWSTTAQLKIIPKWFSGSTSPAWQTTWSVSAWDIVKIKIHTPNTYKTAAEADLMVSRWGAAYSIAFKITTKTKE